MTDQRRYDPALVDDIRKSQHLLRDLCMDIVRKPVPDDDRPHAMDPRLYEIAARKRAARGNNGDGRLSTERNRTDKVTLDLTETEILRDEFLVPVDGDHLIDVFSYRRADDAHTLVPALVYLHGGNFIAGNATLFEKHMAFIAERAHAAVYFPEYRLSPETPFPGAIRDARATVCYLNDHAKELGIAQNRIMIAGDSAGGSLACACLLLDDRVIIKQAVLLYPIVDLRTPAQRDSYQWSYDAYPHLSEQDEIVRSRIEKLRASIEGGRLASLYLQGHDPCHPLASVALATDEQLARWPKVVICNAEFDYLRMDAEAFGRRLAGLGNEVELVTYCGCDHGFFDLLGTVVQAEETALFIAGELSAL